MTWDEEHDVVVVGAGGGGLTGAWAAARAGLDVLLVEASDRYGGTTAYSGGGMWFPGNAVLRDGGVADDADEARDYFRAVVGDRTPQTLQDAFLAAGPRLVDELLTDEALVFEPFPWPDYYGRVPGAREVRQIRALTLDPAELGPLAGTVRPTLKVDRAGEQAPAELVGGQALIGRLLLALSRLPQAQLRPETACAELVVDGGRVVGIVTENAGGPRRIRVRRGVLIASGGFEQNAAMRTEHGVPGSVTGAMGPEGNQGRAIRAAIDIGADTDLMDQAWWAPGLAHPDGTTSFSLWFTGGIFVDRDGRRFVNESLPYDRIGRAVIDGQRAGTVGTTYWMVYDDREGLAPPVRSTTLPLAPQEEYVAAGLWHTADTLGGLAEAIGVPVEELEATVQRFNGFAETGRDDDHGRGDEPYDRAFSGGGSPLVPIAEGPFHAAAFGLSDLGTKGGLRTDEHARVLARDGEVIPGLYAAGNSMAAVSGTTYPAGGNPIAASMAFSHLAIQHLTESEER
ncbi:FAD-binding protein [Nocardioides sp. NPDC057577]|uniref:FAD-binding protein n=1 Tax=Nocardioides sp. NPDC057577 TaxID=3346171 RepID=UPI00366CF462